jgi:peptidoglycan/LPS O-acetylase OafA/YrhL
VTLRAFPAHVFVVALFLLAANPLLADDAAADKPKLTARPQGVNSG